VSAAAPLALVHGRFGWEEKALVRRAGELGFELQVVSERELALGAVRPAGGRLAQGAPVLLRCPSFFRSTVAAAALAAAGHPVLNRHEVLALAGEKAKSDLWLRRSGLPTLPSLVLLSLDRLDAVRETLGFPLVVKPNVGGFGRLVQRLDDEDDLRHAWEYLQSFAPASHRLLYLQRLVDVAHDVRLLVLDGELLAAIERVAPGTLVKNVERGAQAVPWPTGHREHQLAAAIGGRLPGAFLGIDLLIDRDGARWVGEINAVPRFRAAAEMSGADVAGRLLTHLATLDAAEPRRRFA